VTYPSVAFCERLDSRPMHARRDRAIIMSYEGRMARIRTTAKRISSFFAHHYNTSAYCAIEYTHQRSESERNALYAIRQIKQGLFRLISRPQLSIERIVPKNTAILRHARDHVFQLK